MNGIEREIDILKFLPPVSRDSLEIQEAVKSEQVELQELWDALCNIFDNQYIRYMTGYGLSQWEKIFDVTVRKNDTLRTRRQRILELLYGSRPYTLESFQDMLNYIYGDGKVKLELHGDKYELWFYLPGDFNYKAADVRAFAEIIVPKNLLLFFRNKKELMNSNYIGGWARHRSSVHILADTSISIGPLLSAHSTSGYVHIRKALSV